MGWSSGSTLADNVWSVVRPFIPDENKQEVARRLIDYFEDADCDTMDETTLMKNANKEYQ